MDKEIIFLIEESSEGGYEARALGYSIYTEAEDLEQLKIAISDAVKCHFEEKERPKIIRLHFVKDEVMTI
uniref:2-oxoisovalerate dehydrogenase n=1 Tax=candidate division WOR-3 bacterium TaxID=2052148 RepID=A0A7C6EDA0_UNCW3